MYSDINECSDPRLHNCSGDQMCQNTWEALGVLAEKVLNLAVMV